MLVAAVPDILYDSRAHIGTDKLTRSSSARGRLEALGVGFHWNTRLTSA
jgi:uncharacterized FAD-dependent dehydrogenase